MKSIHAMFLALSVFSSATVAAREPIPIVDIVAQPVAAASGKKFSAGEVCQTIRTVAEDKKWSISQQSEDKLNASLSWNGNKHSIFVDIACAPDGYSLAYKDSVNMKYDMLNGQRVIHPYYGRYVNALREAVRSEFMRR